MKFNLKKNWYYLIPVGLGAYLIYRQFAKKSDPKTTAPPPPPPPPPAPKSNFPLSKGSKNETVKTLQNTLNVGLQAQGKAPLLDVDGDFGSKTLAALQGLASKSSISNQSELDTLRQDMVELTSLGAELDWGWKLLDAYNSKRFSKLLVKSPVVLVGYTKNFEGKFIKNGKTLSLPVRTYNLSDYNLLAVAKDGTMRIEAKNLALLSGIYYTPDSANLKSTFDII